MANGVVGLCLGAQTAEAGPRQRVGFGVFGICLRARLGGVRTKCGFLASCVEGELDKLLVRRALRRERLAKGFGMAWNVDGPSVVARVDASRVGITGSSCWVLGEDHLAEGA